MRTKINTGATQKKWVKAAAGIIYGWLNEELCDLSQVIVICFLSLIPWPGPSVFKIQCSRESARVVRKIVQSKWLPILDKYQVKLPLECPFHPMRDIFGPQNAAKKQNRPSQWTCGFCGKSFYEEKFLDLHFDNRHKNNINMVSFKKKIPATTELFPWHPSHEFPWDCQGFPRDLHPNHYLYSRFPPFPTAFAK